MDWAPVIKPFVADEVLGSFRYDMTRADNSSIPTVLRGQGGVVESLPLVNDEAWEKWFESDIFQGRHLEDSPHSQDLSGFHVLLSPHMKPIKGQSKLSSPGATGDGSRHLFSGTAERPEPKPISLAHNNLPFSRSRWEKITKAFLLHKVFLHPRRRNKCQSTYLASKHGHTDVELHTAVTAPYNQPGSISLSCTYFSKPKLSLAVIYGCTSEQLVRVTGLLRDSPEVAAHPLLMVGIVAELQLDRMQKLLWATHRAHDMNLRAFELHWSSNKSVMIRELNNCLRNGVSEANTAAEQMRTAQAWLKEMADRFEDQQKTWKTWQSAQDVGQSAQDVGQSAQDVRKDDPVFVADRFRCRFREIDFEIDGLMAQCRLAADNQTQTGTTFMSENSRQEAVASRLQARQSTFLALIATIFLPMTSVATIFAVPAFKFDNNWLDTRFKPVNGSTDDNDLSTPTDAIKPVFSGYGIIFISISTLLTCITVGAYFHLKWRAAKEDEDDLESADRREKDLKVPAAGTTGTDVKKHNGGASDTSSRLGSIQSTVGDGILAALAAIGLCLTWPWFCRTRKSNGYGGNSGGSQA